MNRQRMQKTRMLLSTFLSLLLVILLVPSLAAAGEIFESPPNNPSGGSTPCSELSNVSNTVHFEGNRWLQVCTNGTELEGYILDYGLGTSSKILSLQAEKGVSFFAPRVAVMAAGGIVVLWNQSNDVFQISTDTPIYMVNFDYSGRQVTKVSSLQDSAGQ